MPSDTPTDPIRRSAERAPSARPAPTSTPSPAPHATPAAPSDEISLRDLYLTLRRGAWIIVLAALVAGAAAFGYVTLQPPSYSAAAITRVAPPPVGGSEDDPFGDVTVGFDTYRAVATSQRVIAAVQGAWEEAGFPADAGDRLDEAAFEGRATLGQLSDAGAVRLTVEHGATASEPERAALLANAWADATLAALRSDLRDELSATATAADAELTRLEAARDEAQAAWDAFRARDDRTLLESRLQSIAGERNSALIRVDQVATELEASQARQALLRTQLGSAPAGDADAQLRVLEENGLIDEATAEQLRILLEQRPEASDNDLLALIRRTALQGELIESAGMSAERESLRERIDALVAEAGELRADIARLQGESEVLERELLQAETDLEGLAGVPSQLTLAQELVPTVGRVVNDASVPTEADPDRRLLLTLVAALLAAAAAALFVLLREAVRIPEPAAG